MSPEKKKIYAVIIIAVFCLIIVTGVGNFRAKQLAVDLAGQRVSNTLTLAVADFDNEKLQELIQTQNQQNAYYGELRAKLMQLKTEHQLENIYMLYKDEQNKVWFFVVDARAEDDPAHLALGQLENNASSAVENTLKGKVVQGEYHTTSLGTFVSSYQEVKDAGGKTYAVLAGDIDVKNVTEFLYLTRYVQFGIMAVSLLLIGLIVYLSGRKNIN
ncbi:MULTISPECIES: hypothetical protein [Dehalobacter]|jgi:hypothetical protein|uniref:Methyl-accepting chemotaxis protein n=1 Tax=Dehalobacter restrictus TaxID=55583 RepID=A0A857DE24_9FIRM|nr:MULTISPECIES: hypothetical protein [Dehalobacter]MCG1025517.1 hypothetical protein [Dehalobacter sp.]MDJ0306120.1 hypothetical protein [Dehalobacter sp.]OCZ51922.1 hypothetical protein A7D23_12180 [Dehalobacter sp. TeCB1]QGZ99489.1 hypothetical protein GQ588_01845 [Dehalobacter restrictus]